MRQFFKFLVLLTIVVAIISCGTKNVLKFKDTDVVISMAKEPCEGKCSVYNLKIYKNQYAVYEGKANAERYGVYYRKMTKAEYQSLIRDFDNTKFFDFDDNYPSGQILQPIVKLTYNSAINSKTITGKMDRPVPLLNLQRGLEKMVSGTDWVLVKPASAKVTQEIGGDIEADSLKQEVIIDSEIIIEPNPNTFLSEWFKKYTEYDVYLIKKVAPESNLWLITYSKSKISAEDFLAKIKSDDSLKTAVFNKRLTSRGN